MHTIEKDYISKHGYRCIVLMYCDMGHRNGYVGIPDSHPLYGVEYDQSSDLLRIDPEMTVGKRGIIPLVCGDKENVRPDLYFDVHGSLTYSGGGDYPVKSDPQLWWFGFDCGHHGDGCDVSVMPESKRTFFASPYPVRSTEYVTAECNRLSEQLFLLEKRD